MTNEPFELNTILMRSTFKLAGEGSIGTAFIIGRPKKTDTNKAYYVMVTASHVLDDMKGTHATLFLRSNIDNYQKIPFQLEISREGKPLWLRHPDELVDVAVMYVDLPTDIDICLLSTAMLANDDILKKFEIHPGDELMCLGYPFGAEATEVGLTEDG